MVDDRAFNNQPSIIESVQLKEKDYDGLLIFGVILDREGGKLPSRGQMAEVTRTFNREFHYTPVVIVFKYGSYLCFSNCERIPYKQDWREGEKAGKVSLLMDIDTVNTHTGHLKILQNLAIPTTGKKAVTTFDGLYNYWQEVFSVSLLSKRFYQELSNWYFWTLAHVEFPDDEEKDREVRNATSVIRLITRLMFVWFLKEKNLVPDALFDKDELDEHLNYKDYHNSTYYKAILQNLFFATLNTKMKKDDPESRKFVNRQYGIQEFYRYERFFKNKQKALKLFETIPFLNGGLFENLDKNIGKPDEVRLDCFSNRPAHEKRLKVPDFLFFGAEDQIDLSDVYGSKKRKNETVKGIIHILNSYKFTIAENTPIEEEIALDPELLGKVFENLLASYNPETKTTARKQTGSFYTPREIVNYMVDESLIAYLEGKLIESFQKKSRLIPKTPLS
ncbi:MAG: SAM-dependent DNA methyltransferase, partial [Deltaproteobacteria bacterium]|nr:SAM-dependent DNA methyltransferase [Deltaproteobacteria bacterium]